MTPAEFFALSKDILFSPRVFFRQRAKSEGFQKAFTYALIVFYIKCVMGYLSSYHEGYFVSEKYPVTPYTLVYAGSFLLIAPIIGLFLMTTQCYFLHRIGQFFGSVGNLESAVKALCYPTVISIFAWSLLLFPLAMIYSLIVMLIAIHELFNIDYLSSFLALFFSAIFALAFYFLIILPPAVYFGFFVLF